MNEDPIVNRTAGVSPGWFGLVVGLALLLPFVAYALLAPTSYATTAHITIEPVPGQPLNLPTAAVSIDLLRDAALDLQGLAPVAAELGLDGQRLLEAKERIGPVLAISSSGPAGFSVTLRDSDAGRAERICNFLASRAAARAPAVLVSRDPALATSAARAVDPNAELSAFLAKHPELVGPTVTPVPSAAPTISVDAQIASLRAEHDQINARLGFDGNGEVSDSPYEALETATALRLERRLQEIETRINRLRRGDRPAASTASTVAPEVEREWRRLLRAIAQPAPAAVAAAQPFLVRMTRATRPASPLTPNRRFWFAAGGASGLLGFVLATLFWRARRKRARFTSDPLIAFPRPSAAPTEAEGPPYGQPFPADAPWSPGDSNAPAPPFPTASSSPPLHPGSDPPRVGSAPPHGSSNPPAAGSEPPPFWHVPSFETGSPTPAHLAQTLPAAEAAPAAPHWTAPLGPTQPVEAAPLRTIEGSPMQSIRAAPVKTIGTAPAKPVWAPEADPHAPEPLPGSRTLSSTPPPRPDGPGASASPGRTLRGSGIPPIVVPRSEPFGVTPSVRNVSPTIPPPAQVGANGSDAPNTTKIFEATVERQPLEATAQAAEAPAGSPEPARAVGFAGKRSRTTQMLGSPITPTVRGTPITDPPPPKRPVSSRPPTTYSYSTTPPAGEPRQSPPPQPVSAPPRPSKPPSQPSPRSPLPPQRNASPVPPPREPAHEPLREPRDPGVPRPVIHTHHVHSGWAPDRTLVPESRRGIADQLLPLAVEGCFVVGVSGVPEARAHKTRVAAELALAIAASGFPRVLLVEGDFHWPIVHDVMHVEMPMSAGFSQQLRTHASGPRSWTVVECSPSLHVMAEGIMRSPGLILSSYFEDSLRSFRAHYDFLVIDGPLTSSEVDCRALDSLVDGVVLVSPSSGSQWLAQATRLFSEKRFSMVVGVEHA